MDRQALILLAYTQPDTTFRQEVIARLENPMAIFEVEHVAYLVLCAQLQSAIQQLNK